MLARTAHADKCIAGLGGRRCFSTCAHGGKHTAGGAAHWAAHVDAAITNPSRYRRTKPAHFRRPCHHKRRHCFGQQRRLPLHRLRGRRGRRTFTRHIRAATGTTFNQWLLEQRLARAQRLLETSDSSLDRVAQHAGFGSTESLRSHFNRAFGVSPAAYRRTFHAVA
ncbi:helix-turn-helix domain-containing protein [Stenotrophomonas rhizophila]|uniref:helix-turn-helix domain-containing protein n=1 Tax=Stenotrophomonas rhizophila TaxID=216778 RepID=UPI001C4F31FB